MTLETTIADLLTDPLEAMGYELVRVTVTQTTTPTVQVMLEARDYGGLTMEQAAEMTPVISTALDLADPIDGAYNLEVSSPGIDRPLTRLKDYIRFEGFEARIETLAPIEGRKRFIGVLAGVADDDMVQLDCEDEEGEFTLSVAFSDIKRAKLVMSDALIAATMPTEAMADTLADDPPVLDAAVDEEPGGHA